MRKKVIMLVMVLSIIATLSGSLQAEIVIYEPFDYPAGVIDGSQAGGIGLAATGWTTSGDTNFQSVITPSPGSRRKEMLCDAGARKAHLRRTGRSRGHRKAH